MIKFMVYNLRHFLRYIKRWLLILLLAGCLAAAVMIFGPKAVDIWSENRQIPVYSVDCPDKKASIYTANLLPTIIAVLKKDGYAFLPVSKLIMRDNYIIDFNGRQKRKDK